MRLTTIIATPHPDAPRKWDIEAKLERDHFDTNVARVEWYFGARSDDAVHTGKSLVVKDYTFKGDNKIVRVVITDTKGITYRGEITLSAAADKDAKESKKTEPKKSEEKKQDAKKTEEKEPEKTETPVLPASEPILEAQETEKKEEETANPDTTFTPKKVVVPEAPQLKTEN